MDLQDLVSRCVGRVELFRGTINDLSPSGWSNAFLNAPQFRRAGPAIALCGTLPNQGIQEVGGGLLVDVTGSFTIEMLFAPQDANLVYLFRQYAGGTGGILCSWNGGNLGLILYDNAGATWTIATAGGPYPKDGSIYHVVFRMQSAGSVGDLRVDGGIAAVTGGAGTPANAPAGPRYLFQGPSTRPPIAYYIRWWQEWLSDEESLFLYDESKRIATPVSTRRLYFPYRYATPGVLYEQGHWICDLEVDRVPDLSGNSRDLDNVAGCPISGHDGGIAADDDPLSYWYNSTSVDVGQTNMSYEMDHDIRVPPPQAVYQVVKNGDHCFVDHAPGGFAEVAFSLDNGATLSTSGFMTDRGRLFATGTFDGTDQILYINGREVDRDAVAPTSPAGGQIEIGRHGVTRRAIVRSARLTADEVRERYVRHFGSKLVFSFDGRGQGQSSTAIATDEVGEDWWCPLGGGGLKWYAFADQSNPGLVYKALYDSGGSNRRIDIDFPSPVSRTWVFEYVVNDPAADNPFMGGIGVPGSNMRAAGNEGYYLGMLQSGGLWQTRLYCNAGAILLILDIPLPTAGDTLMGMYTITPLGDFRLYVRDGNGRWHGDPATVVNDTTYNTISSVSLMPRGACIKSARAYLGELEPSELPSCAS